MEILIGEKNLLIEKIRSQLEVDLPIGTEIVFVKKHKGNIALIDCDIVDLISNGDGAFIIVANKTSGATHRIDITSGNFHKKNNN